MGVLAAWLLEAALEVPVVALDPLVVDLVQAVLASVLQVEALEMPAVASGPLAVASGLPAVVLGLLAEAHLQRAPLAMHLKAEALCGK